LNTHSLVEISLCDLDDAATPSVINLFDRWGRGGAVVEQMAGQDGRSNVKTYLLPEDDESLRQIEIGLVLLSHARDDTYLDDHPSTPRLPQPRIRFISETDWAEAWKTGYDVFRAGRRLVIKPTWRDYAPQPGDLIIELDPGMAFGSGLHPTTRLCLEALEDYLPPEGTVLDVGTGSGILAIAAARLGASRVLALDTDPLAVRVARENVGLNQVEPVVDVELGTVGISNRQTPAPPQVRVSKSGERGIRKSGNQEISLPPGLAVRAGWALQGESGNRGAVEIQASSWDLVAANILAETIIELMPALALTLSATGTLIASGILSERREAVIASLRENGLSLVEQRDEGEWVALIACQETKDR